MNTIPKPKKRSKNGRKSKAELIRLESKPFDKYWENKCERMFWKIYYAQYSTGTCQVGKIIGFHECTGNIMGHHLILRDNYLYRWDFNNIFDICGHHHDRFNKKLSPHGTPARFMAWLSEHYPEKWEMVKANKHVITRKVELPWTFREKYFELNALWEKISYQESLN